MKSKELSPEQQALIDVPKTWYEVDQKFIAKITIWGGYGLLLANYGVFHLDSIPVHVTAATLYIISALADRYSTIKGFEAADKANEVGLGVEIMETQMGISNVKNTSDYIHTRRPLVMDAIGTIVSTLIPPFGISLATGKDLAAVNNLRKIKRLKREMEIV